jgi:hypothetical protein
MDASERALALIELLQATPSLEDLEKLFDNTGLKSEVAKKVWGIITDNGWDGAQRSLKERATRLCFALCVVGPCVSAK